MLIGGGRTALQADLAYNCTGYLLSWLTQVVLTTNNSRNHLFHTYHLPVNVQVLNNYVTCKGVMSRTVISWSVWDLSWNNSPSLPAFIHSFPWEAGSWLVISLPLFHGAASPWWQPFLSIFLRSVSPGQTTLQEDTCSLCVLWAHVWGSGKGQYHHLITVSSYIF